MADLFAEAFEVTEDNDPVIEGENIAIGHDPDGAVIIEILHGCCPDHRTRIRLRPEGASIVVDDLIFETEVAMAIMSGRGPGEPGCA